MEFYEQLGISFENTKRKNQIIVGVKLVIDIDKVKGIIIEPDGIAHSFGHCLMIPKEIEITHERHEKCFEEEILTSNWWKDNKVNYDYNQYYYSQLGNLTKPRIFTYSRNNSCVTT